MFSLTKQQWILTAISLVLLILVSVFFLFLKPESYAIKVGESTIKPEWIEQMARVQKTSEKNIIPQLVQMQWDIKWATEKGVSLQGNDITGKGSVFKNLDPELKVFINQANSIQANTMKNESLLMNAKVSERQFQEYREQSKYSGLFLLAFFDKKQAKISLAKLEKSEEKFADFQKLSQKYGKYTNFFISQQTKPLLEKQSLPKTNQIDLIEHTYSSKEIDQTFPPGTEGNKQAKKMFLDKTVYIMVYNYSSNNSKMNRANALKQAQLAQIFKEKTQIQQAYKKQTICKKKYFSKFVCGQQK